jgi:alpha-beta hydrolase superfamily lysophospholipase
LKPGEDFFHWDGKNDWRSRAKATTRLLQEIKRLKSDGWIVHLVGHSHGGNIIIDATIDDKGEAQPWLNGRVTLFGTLIYQR